MKRIAYVALLAAIGVGYAVGAPVAPPAAAPAVPAAVAAPPAAAAPVRPVIRRAAGSIANHAIIISIDGCRPDVLLRAKTPFIHGLLERGTFTFYAETTDVANTLPSHTSMLTGVKPEVHGIDYNKDPDDEAKIVYPKVPTVLELAHDAGMTTGVFSTKSKFRVYTRPGVVEYSFIIRESSSPDDLSVARKAAEAIVAHKPGVMHVHFGNTDKQGHAKGWGSPEQMEALAGADKAVEMVFNALEEAKIADQTLVIISSDHGGSGTSHGKDDPRSRYIPWIAVGPQVRKNYDLTRNRNVTVHTEDTFATACHFLGLPLPAGIYGKPIRQIIVERQLLQSTTQPAKPGN